MNTDARVWQEAAVAGHFLTGVRGALPFAVGQMEVMLRVVQGLRPSAVGRFLDLGCGDGVLGAQILAQYPESQGLFIDFSAAMLTAGQKKLASYTSQTAFLELDYGQPSWVKHPQSTSPSPLSI